MVGVCAQGTREGGRPGLPLRPQKMLLPKQLDKHRGQRKGGGLRQKTLHSLKTSFQKKGWRWVRGNPNGLPGTPGRREGRVESPRSPVTPPRWWLRPWRSSPPDPREGWEGLLRGCTPLPRRAAASPRLPRPRHCRTRSLPPPCPVPSAWGQPPIPTTSASGPPPPAAPSSSRRRRRRQESDRLPVQGRAAAACAKLGYPKAALAACCPPSRPRRILRSPCRRAAISDKRLRNLPKCAGPEMAEPGRSGAREAGDGRHFPDCARRAAKASGSAAGLA